MSESDIELPPLEERPLVTFALFAYNQEKYIREAVEGAFSQTYEPLEIILSDDCSTDRTFEIMQEMAAEYKGPHKVAVRKTQKNIGLISHLQEVFDISTTEWIVVAAGDDISLSNRVEEVMKATQYHEHVNLVSSAYAVIDAESNQIDERNIYFKDNMLCDNVYDTYGINEMLNSNSPEYHGATLSYSKKLLNTFEKLENSIIYEDTVYRFRSSITGKCVHINKTLIKYRIHELQSTTLEDLDLFSLKKKLILLRKNAYMICHQYEKDFNKFKDNIPHTKELKRWIIKNTYTEKYRYYQFSKIWPIRLLYFFMYYIFKSNSDILYGKRTLAIIFTPDIFYKYINLFLKKNK